MVFAYLNDWLVLVSFGSGRMCQHHFHTRYAKRSWLDHKRGQIVPHAVSIYSLGVWLDFISEMVFLMEEQVSVLVGFKPPRNCRPCYGSSYSAEC